MQKNLALLALILQNFLAYAIALKVVKSASTLNVILALIK
jgi:hypothetical protein